MAYKPPIQSIIDDETGALPSSEAVFEALKEKVDVTSGYDINPQFYDAGSKTGNFAVDFSLGPVQQVTVSASGPLTVTLSNPVVGGVYMLKVVQSATTGTLAWPASVRWSNDGEPNLSTDPSAIDLVSFVYDGTDYFGSYSLGY
jgi:hypothetical protein